MNKPVAWMFEYGTDRGDAVNGISWYPNVHFKKPDLGGLIRNIEPLYTHPVKEELTDEEIEIAKNESTVYKGIYDGYGNGIGQKREIDYKIFAKAILRKAQGK